MIDDPLVDPGVSARAAWSAPSGLHRAADELAEPATEPIPVPVAPGRADHLPTSLPRGTPVSAEGLHELASDAIRRAWAQLANDEPSHLQLDEAADLARRAAAHLDQLDALGALARRAGTTTSSLARQAVAWRSAGPDGLDVLDDDRWAPPRRTIELGLEAFEDAGVDRDEVRVRANRLTAGDVQLRVTPDERWWRYEQQGRRWELVEPPVEHPGDLLDG
jgi:hypothetical protein